MSGRWKGGASAAVAIAALLAVGCGGAQGSRSGAYRDSAPTSRAGATEVVVYDEGEFGYDPRLDPDDPVHGSRSRFGDAWIGASPAGWELLSRDATQRPSPRSLGERVEGAGEIERAELGSTDDPAPPPGAAGVDEVGGFEQRERLLVVLSPVGEGRGRGTIELRQVGAVVRLQADLWGLPRGPYRVELAAPSACPVVREASDEGEPAGRDEDGERPSSIGELQADDRGRATRQWTSWGMSLAGPNGVAGRGILIRPGRTTQLEMDQQGAAPVQDTRETPEPRAEAILACGVVPEQPAR